MIKFLRKQKIWFSKFKNQLIAASLFIALIGNNFVSFAFDLKISKTIAFQGETIMIKLPLRISIKSAFLGNLEGMIFDYKNSKRVIFALPITQPPGRHRLRIYLADGSLIEKQIIIKPRKVAKINLGIPKQLGLSPENLIKTIATQKNNLKSIISHKTDAFFSSPFGLPLYDNRKISSYFGEIRLTGGQEIRHLGVDFAAPKGTPVATINDGMVVKAYTDHLYGNSVIVNHGAGIYSLYLHLDQIKVSESKKSKKAK